MVADAPEPLARGDGGSNLPPRHVTTDESGGGGPRSPALLTENQRKVLEQLIGPGIEVSERPVSGADPAGGVNMDDPYVAARLPTLCRIFDVDSSDADVVGKLAIAARARGYISSDLTGDRQWRGVTFNDRLIIFGLRFIDRENSTPLLSLIDVGELLHMTEDQVQARIDDLCSRYEIDRSDPRWRHTLFRAARDGSA
jgi:hypothetical protein